MKKINLFLSLFFSFSPLFGADATLDTAPTKELKITYPAQGTCAIAYPSVNNYDVRLKKIDLSQGLFEYYLYQDQQIIKSDIFWINEACKKQYSGLDKNDIAKVENELKNIDFSSKEKVQAQVGETIKVIESKYDKNGKNTENQVLPTSKYLVAVLTMDSSVINIPASISTNQIILKNDYILSQNELNEKLNLNFFSFIFRWVTQSDLIFKQLQMLLLSIFVPVSIVLMSFSKVSKKTQGLFDQEDIVERGIFGVVIFILFVIAPHRYDDKSKDLAYAQSIFQNKVGFLARTGTDYADRLTNVLTMSYLDKLKKDVGIASKDEAQEVLEHLSRINKEILTYKTLQTMCYENEKGAFLNNANRVQADGISIFPYSEIYQSGNNDGLKWNEEQIFKSWNDTSKNIKYTSTFCRNVDIQMAGLERAHTLNKKYIENLKQSSSSSSIQDYATTAENMLKASNNYGFIYAPFVIFNKVFIENYGLMKPIDNSDQIEKGEDEKWLNKVMYYAPLVNAPFVESTLKVYKEMDIVQGVKRATNALAGGVPIVGEGIKTGTDYLIDKGAFILIIGLMSKVYEYLPFIAIAIASILVISYFSVTLFVYTLISPFYVVYVFASQQKESIIAFFVRGIVIIFKPVLIVLSIVVAILATELITSIGYILTNEIFTFFTKNDIASSFTLSSMIISFLHGMVDLAIAIITTLFSFYFIFKGSNLILSVFGYSGGGIDSHEVVGEVEQKIGHRGIGA
jgi:hypothetical protein